MWTGSHITLGINSDFFNQVRTTVSNPREKKLQLHREPLLRQICESIAVACSSRLLIILNAG